MHLKTKKLVTLYYSSHFMAVIWNWTHNIYEACLYIFKDRDTERDHQFFSKDKLTNWKNLYCKGLILLIYKVFLIFKMRKSMNIVNRKRNENSNVFHKGKCILKLSWDNISPLSDWQKSKSLITYSDGKMQGVSLS